MEERPIDQLDREGEASPRRRRGLVAVLAVVAALAAVPVGVALAGGSDGASGAGATPAQSTTPDDGQRDHDDCPEKDRQGGQESVQL